MERLVGWTHYNSAGRAHLRSRNNVRLLLKTVGWVLGSTYWPHKLAASSFTSKHFDSISCSFLRYFSRRCLALLGLYAAVVHAEKNAVTHHRV